MRESRSWRSPGESIVSNQLEKVQLKITRVINNISDVDAATDSDDPGRPAAMTIRLGILTLTPALVCRPQQQRKLPSWSGRNG